MDKLTELRAGMIAADEVLGLAIARHAPGATRWSMSAAQRAIPEIVGAYRAKVAADDAYWIEVGRRRSSGEIAAYMDGRDK